MRKMNKQYKKENESFGDWLSDFFDKTYGLGIVLVAIFAILVPLILAQIIAHFFKFPF